MVAKRYEENILFLSRIEDKIYVKCPSCDKKAVVNASGASDSYPNYHKKYLLRCPHCLYQEIREIGGLSSNLAQAEIHYTCPYCNTSVTKLFLARERRNHFTVKCHVCGRLGNHHIEYCKYKGSQAVDPYFYKPLFLQTSHRGETLWAYNEIHINLLKRYVGATLRERAPKINASIVSKLPQWIKSRKHKASILKALTKLEEILEKSN